MDAPKVTIQRAQTLRKAMSPPEVVLWQYLRGHKLRGLRFRRQHPFGPYILDFFCPSCGLAVEVDGFLHERPNQMAKDARRDNWLAEQGVRTVRIPSHHIREDVEIVLNRIATAAADAS